MFPFCIHTLHLYIHIGRYYIYIYYIPIGRYCKEEFDECSLHPCHNGNCTDGLHSFTCNCFPGYTGDTCQLKTSKHVSIRL